MIPLFVLSFGGENYNQYGKLELIDRAVDPQTGTIRVRLRFPNAENRLRPGMTAVVKVLSSPKDAVVRIPYKAVTEQLGEYFVYVVQDSNKVSQRHIIPGRQLGAEVIVKEGLQAGEKIVVQGVQNLREGSVVSIN
ncbi:MAG: efflux RND transporter periplasmic adaptor subunit [Chitinophagaceae bacterium]|nr:efflux RND transporter periplasmic adaptor subunit [Chitinophagaceae bacterium]